MIATTRDIELLLARILSVSSPTAVYMFGSQANGQAHASSDIDLLIVEPSTLPRQHRGKATAASLRGFAANFDLLFYTPQELAEEITDPLSFAAANTRAGRIIYERSDSTGATVRSIV